MGIWKNLGMGGYRGFSRPAARLLQQAVQLAGDLGCEQADTGHLLLAMLQQQGAAAQFLTRKNITEPEVRRQLAQRRSAYGLPRCFRHFRGDGRHFGRVKSSLSSPPGADDHPGCQSKIIWLIPTRAPG